MSTPGVVLVQGQDDVEAYKSVQHESAPNWEWIYLPENLGWAQGTAKGRELFPGRDWYGFLYDDVFPVTPEWDRKLLERLKPWHFVSCNNRYHVDDKGEIAYLQTGIIGKDLIEAIGFFTIPGTWSCYTDGLWEQLGTDLDIWIKCNDIIVDTLNPRKGDYPWDIASEMGYGGGRPEQDRALYMGWMAENYIRVRDEIAEKVGQPPAEYDWEFSTWRTRYG